MTRGRRPGHSRPAGRRTAGTVPIERALSKLGVATRSEARRLIQAGRVSVRGRTIRDPREAVSPERGGLTIDGRGVERAGPITIALNKPGGVVTTRHDPDRRRTVYDLLETLDAHVVPVGRLDYATSGLLLLTNDTRLADWLTDPVNAVLRVYLVTVRGEVRQADAGRLESGIESRGERLQAQHVLVRKASQRETHLVVELSEGRNREVRRMMAAIGHEVTRLRRVQFGGIHLGRLASGDWRRLSDEELRRAFPGAPVSKNRLRATERRG